MSEPRESLPEWLADIEPLLNEDGMLAVVRWRQLLELCLAQRKALKSAGLFTKYAWYLCEDGESGPGSQFPHKGDAEKLQAKIAVAEQKWEGK